MKIWYDACTGKHVRYGVAIANRLRRLGHEVVLTTRKHPDTLPLARFLKEKFITVGRYNPESLHDRLRESTQRQLLFCKMFKGNAPDLAISHGSVDQIRVAFGLGTPTITTVDTPRADAVHRLTLPLVDYIVASRAIPRKILQTYNVRAKIVSFNGVDEVAWVRNPTVKMSYNYKKPLIVVRQLEEKAVYTEKKINIIALAKKLRKLGEVVFLSRYNRRPIKDLIVPRQFVDSVSLVTHANLFLGVGGTITREAALQGTPAMIVKFFPRQYVNDFLEKKSFPIFKAKPSQVFELAEKLLYKKLDVKHQLAKLENPVNAITNIATHITR